MKTTIVYHAVRQPFTEYDEQGDVIKRGAFMLPEKTERIIEQDNATIVFLDDGSKGVAKCHPDDVQRVGTGRNIAYLRAKLEYTKNQLKKAIKATHVK
jgi:hypothetical protein